MGADVRVAMDNNTALVKGGAALSGAPVEAPDIRAGAALVIAGLAASGETEIIGLEYIDRGYERLEETLSALGAQVQRSSGVIPANRTDGYVRNQRIPGIQLVRPLRVALAAILLVVLGFGGSGAATPDRVRIIFDPSFYSHLPILRAMDAGYFRDEGIDLQLTPNNGSSTAFLPMLARGDFDLGTANPSPAFFNQFSAGFNVVLLAGRTGSHAGWHDTTWLMVRQDLWDSKAIRVPADLKGKIADGANVGSPIDFLLKQTIRSGGLTVSDVRVGERYKSPADALEGLKNHAVDVVGVNEPAAGQIEAQGYAHRWLSSARSRRGTSPPSRRLGEVRGGASLDHPPFHPGLRRGNNDILKSGGKWTR